MSRRADIISILLGGKTQDLNGVLRIPVNVRFTKKNEMDEDTHRRGEVSRIVGLTGVDNIGIDTLVDRGKLELFGV